MMKFRRIVCAICMDEVIAIGEIAVGYKATAVVYRLTYDRNMKLAGFFVK